MELNISVLIQLGIFLFLYGWLRLFLFKPLLKTLNDRESQIVGAAELAKTLNASNENLAQEIEDKMSNANAQARVKLTALREEGQRIERDLIEGARTEAQEQIAQAKEQIQSLKNELSSDLAKESQALAGTVVSQVLGRA